MLIHFTSYARKWEIANRRLSEDVAAVQSEVRKQMCRVLVFLRLSSSSWNIVMCK
jgi:hypothetical protein